MTDKFAAVTAKFEALFKGHPVHVVESVFTQACRGINWRKSGKKAIMDAIASCKYWNNDLFTLSALFVETERLMAKHKLDKLIEFARREEVRADNMKRAADHEAAEKAKHEKLYATIKVWREKLGATSHVRNEDNQLLSELLDWVEGELS